MTSQNGNLTANFRISTVQYSGRRGERGGGGERMDQLHHSSYSTGNCDFTVRIWPFRAIEFQMLIPCPAMPVK